MTGSLTDSLIECMNVTHFICVFELVYIEPVHTTLYATTTDPSALYLQEWQ